MIESELSNLLKELIKKMLMDNLEITIAGAGDYTEVGIFFDGEEVSTASKYNSK